MTSPERRPGLLFLCVANAARSQMAEALARISLIADNGNEWAGAILPGLAEDASATVMASARDYATRIKDRVFGHEAG